MTAAAARIQAVARGLGALLLVLVFLVVPPVALIAAVGWPLPTSIPDLDAIDRAARSGISDQLIVNTLAVVAWLAWAQIALALLVEIVAVIKGRPALHVPALPGVQNAAARLVTGIALLASTANPAAAAAPPPLAVTRIVATVHAPQEVAASAWSADAAATAPLLLTAAPPTVTVQRHDSYWAIAERCLDDGLRWRELRDLNVGRTMADGYLVLPGDDLLRPGWVLELPPDAQGIEPVPPGVTPTVDPPHPAATEATVLPGDDLWSIAEEQLAVTIGRAPTDEEVRPYWQELIAVNDDRLVDPANPGLIYSGQVLEVPAALDPAAAAPVQAEPPAPSTPDEPPSSSTTIPAPEAVVATPPTTPSTPAPSVDQRAPVAERAPDQQVEQTTTGEDGLSSLAPTVIALAGLTSAALAVGVKRAIERRRRQFSAAHPGKASRPTPERERQLHRRIVANADEDGIGDLRSAMSRLARDLAAVAAASRPRVVQHSQSYLDVFLDHPATAAPHGWIVDGDGALWSLDPSADHAPAAGECPAPLLVTLGQPDDGAQLYLDLEADGLISLVGDPAQARGLARSIITEVALSPMTDTVRVIVIGDLIDAASTIDHVAMIDTWEDAIEDIAAWAEQSHQALVANGWSNTFMARGADPDHDALAPLLVVASKPPPAHLIDTIAAHRPGSLAVVVSDEFDGAVCVIDCQADALTLRDLGLSCVPQHLGEETLAAMIRLLDTADEPNDEPSSTDETPPHPDEGTDDELVVTDESVTDPPTLFPTLPGVNGLHVHPPDGQPDLAEPAYEILVRLLGEIRVDGGQPLRSKPTAVVAYIALHRSVSIETLEDACWADPASGSLRKRLKDVMSECRAGIGAHNLPAAANGRYSVGPGVLTDTDLFDLRVARAAAQPPAQQTETYRSALELVTGKVFTYPGRAGSSFGWIDTENLLSQWEVKIQGVAEKCIESYLAIGSPGQAAEIALQMLNALPLNAQLTEALMCAHAATGDLKAADTVYRAHVDGLRRVLNADPEDSTSTLHGKLRSA